MRHPVAYPLLFALLLAGIFPPRPAAADPLGEYRAELVARAKAMRLSADRYWDILLHYKPGLFGRKSLVDEPRFFLSPRGKSDPDAELSATIEGFFREGDEEKESPRCRFPARYEWLSERLGIDASRLPPYDCPTLDNNLRHIDPKAAVFIFATGHMNAPASMFGHTLLRIDSSYESPLLSYAVNYAAAVDPQDGGFAYAFRGIFGFYPGYYSILPYYEKVKEYHGMDQRDLWEYRLKISDGELRRMVLHVLELQEIYSDYYFFRENCSYDLLFLLETARPEARLTERFSAWTIPADTLRAVIDAGLAEPPAYRPSQARRIRHTASFLDAAGIARAAEVADGAAPPSSVAGDNVTDAEKARILDIAAETIQLRYMKKKIPKEEFQGRYHAALAERSRFPDAGANIPDVPPPARPEEGHDSSRASLGGGVREGEAFLEAAYRPAYHDLLDDAAGYTEGSQIDFLAATVRHYPESGRTALHRLDLVHIVSLAERDSFFKPVSWKILAGFLDRPFPDDPGDTAAVVSPGFGFSWRGRAVGLFYVTGDIEAAASGGYERGYAVSAGPAAGIVSPLARSVKVAVSARRLFGILGDREQGSRFEGKVQGGVRLGRNASLFLEAGREDAEGLHVREGKASLNLYF